MIQAPQGEGLLNCTCPLKDFVIFSEAVNRAVVREVLHFQRGTNSWATCNSCGFFCPAQYPMGYHNTWSTDWSPQSKIPEKHENPLHLLLWEFPTSSPSTPPPPPPPTFSPLATKALKGTMLTCYPTRWKRGSTNPHLVLMTSSSSDHWHADEDKHK